MAQDDLQKSVQGIQDPTARKKAYYTAQRESAERSADAGDRSAAASAGKINRKVAGTRTDYFVPETAAQRKATWYEDQSKGGRGGATANAFVNRLGDFFQPGDAEIGAAAGAAGKGLRSLIPRAAEAEEGAASRALGKGRQNLGKASPVKKSIGKVKPKAEPEQKALKGAPESKALPKPKARAVSKVEKGTGNTKMGKKLPKGKVNPKADKGTVTARGDSAHMSNKYYKRMQESTEKLNKMDEAKPKKKFFGR